MMKAVSLFVLTGFGISRALAQIPPAPQVEFEITITDSTKLVSVMPVVNTLNLFLGNAIGVSPLVQPSFSVPAINSIVGGYQITQFTQAYAASRYEWMRQIWRVRCNSAALAAALRGYDSTLFPSYKLLPPPQTLAYTPNDFHNPGSWPIWTKYLDYINARDAWGVSHGNPNVLIGITDTYFDLNHPDLATGTDSKIYSTGATNHNGTGDIGHGTQVAGFAACKTDNSIGYPAMGFNCKMRVSTNWANDGEMLQLSTYQHNGHRVRVLNGSWHNTQCTPNYAPSFVQQNTYNEIYENGVVACFGAGNGRQVQEGGPRTFCYPSSLDHNISVTGVGWETTYGTGTFNVEDVHEITIGDTSGAIHQHNARVDICAPSVRTGGLVYDPQNPTVKYTWDQGGGGGTSFASPMVAGTVGLMFSANPCLSPYQVEYLLKTTAKNIYNRAENVKFLGRLGAGALDAGTAVTTASGYNCNEPSTQTMYIEGIEVNVLCAPGFNAVNSALPKLKVRVVNGTPPYTYKWEPHPTFNETTLDDPSLEEPTITASAGNHLAYYRVTVYDASTIQKVASQMVRTQLTTVQAHRLAMRDSWLDMLAEPNDMFNVDPRDWDIWASPDIWVRKAQDGIEEHQNPEYFSSGAPNYVYARVRNVGCATYNPNPPINPSSSIILYWSRASTGQQWPADWTSAFIQGTNGLMPTGREITGPDQTLPNARFRIPSTPPGGSHTINRPWSPPKPEDYDPSLNSLQACLLARVSPFPTTGMPITEGYDVNVNVRNNIRAIMRNVNIINLGNRGRKVRGLMDIANSGPATEVFSVQFLTDRDVQLHYAGNLSEYLYATIYLGDLYEPWAAGGYQGNVVKWDATERTVTYDPATPLRLDNLSLEASTKYPIFIDFTLRDDVEIPFDISGQRINVQQIAYTNGRPRIFGNVSFAINLLSSESGNYRRAQPAPLSASAAATAEVPYRIFPNPVYDQLVVTCTGASCESVALTVSDLTGRTLISQQNASFPQGRHAINTSALAPGTYFIRVSRAVSGKSHTLKFVKTQ